MMTHQAACMLLMGPTASGKTDLAMQLYDRVPCSIISVDSALVYRGMDIGTAKPDAALLKAYPHALVDVCDPSEVYSVGRFLQDAQAAMEAAVAAGRMPLLVGGTMMYFNLLQQGCAALPEADADVRAALQEEADTVGWPALHARLNKIDPEAAARMHAHDQQRISRALEIHALTGCVPSALQKQREVNQRWHFIPCALWPEDRAVLHQRIEQRVHAMLEAGFLDEVKALHARGDLNASMPALRMVGYRQLWAYLEGKMDYATAVEKTIVATRQLAKRQLTWLRRWPGLMRFPLGSRADHLLNALPRDL